jgi:hypothetical protein
MDLLVWLFGDVIIFQVWGYIPLLIWAWWFQWCVQNLKIMLFKEGWLMDFFGLTFWRWHYFSSLMLYIPTNLGMGISMVCSKFKNSAFLRGLTHGPFGLTFWRCHYFPNLRLCILTNLDMGISVICSKFENWI